MKTICITGAAGNLGSLTAKHLEEHSEFTLRLMIHKKPYPFPISDPDRVAIHTCDLDRKETLFEALTGVDEIIHYAGVLFQAKPESFLPTTNVRYFRNLVEVAKKVGVKRITLVSFPHVEGETDPEHPSTDRMDRHPISVHAATRLEEERLLVDAYPDGVILRVGMVYGRGILMPDAARWFARHRILGVWKKPTGIHLISKQDFLDVVKNVAATESARGVYNIGDDGVQTLQEYLEFACEMWEVPRPWTMPLWMIHTAASVCELASSLLGTRSPLTRDFVKIGRVSYYGDTTRMRKELLPELKYPTMREGGPTF
ncbi:MAG: NAD(P)-dependent oxidoreductase [Fibrobacteria bacterium]|nr:NAD(P)-dependent oxidoreductase [Fibrobacteria bacterium]